jgi:RNA polymerase sigma-70 factor (ECF subfamily)
MDNILDSALPEKRSSRVEAVDSVHETAWVTSSQEGDVVSFNRLVLKWEKKIYNLSFRILRDPNEAAEATQEVFLVAFKRIRQFRQDSSFATWLYRIAVNHCTNRLQRRPGGVHFSLDSSEDGQSLRRNLSTVGSQEEALIHAETLRRVRNALEFLHPEQRVVMELRFFQELKFEQIAEIVEAPLSTVKSRFYTGLEVLKLRLAR